MGKVSKHFSTNGLFLIQAFNFAVEINISMVEIYSSLIDEKLTNYCVKKMPVQFINATPITIEAAM